MKYIFTSLLLCFMLTVFGQSSFEGKIEYDVHLAGEKDPAKLILSFRTNIIKMEFIVPDKTGDNDYVIINLDSGRVYTMNVREKSYEQKALYKKAPFKAPAPKEIAGYRTTPVFQQYKKALSGEGLLDYLSMGYFDIADDLYYGVPDAYAEGNTELMMIKNGKIVLGAHIIDPAKRPGGATAAGGETDSGVVATVSATSVTPMKMDAALFTVPSGYEEKRAPQFQDVELAPVKDLLQKRNDSAIPITPEKKPPRPVQKNSGVAKESMLRPKKH